MGWDRAWGVFADWKNQAGIDAGHRRYDAAARDIDEVSNGEMDDNAMEEYLDELRRAVGIIN